MQLGMHDCIVAHELRQAVLALKSYNQFSISASFNTLFSASEDKLLLNKYQSLTVL